MTDPVLHERLDGQAERLPEERGVSGRADAGMTRAVSADHAGKRAAASNVTGGHRASWWRASHTAVLRQSPVRWTGLPFQR
jgi:hypothetical protein